MKKFILFALLIATSAYSHELEVRVAYFTPDNSRIRNDYTKDAAEYEIEATTPLKDILRPLRRYDLFANIGFYQLGSTKDLRLRNWTFVAGLKRYYCPIDAPYRPYLGFGYGAVNAALYDSSHCSKKHRNRWGHALLAKSGIKFVLTSSVFLDLFADYSYHMYRHKRGSDEDERTVNTGGWLLGVGLGYQY